MAERIQCITVEIGGDTTKLQTAVTCSHHLKKWGEHVTRRRIVHDGEPGVRELAYRG